jgi:hypothetical protein
MDSMSAWCICFYISCIVKEIALSTDLAISHPKLPRDFLPHLARVHVLASLLEQPLLQQMLLDTMIHPTWLCMKCEDTTGFRRASYLQGPNGLCDPHKALGIIRNSGAFRIRDKIIEWAAQVDWTDCMEHALHYVNRRGRQTSHHEEETTTNVDTEEWPLDAAPGAFELRVLAAMHQEVMAKKRE